jgi:hypothetical protein
MVLSLACSEDLALRTLIRERDVVAHVVLGSVVLEP